MAQNRDFLRKRQAQLPMGMGAPPPIFNPKQMQVGSGSPQMRLGQQPWAQQANAQSQNFARDFVGQSQLDAGKPLKEVDQFMDGTPNEGGGNAMGAGLMGLQMMQGSMGGDPKQQQQLMQMAQQRKMQGMMAMQGGQQGMQQATEMMRRRQAGGM